MPLAHMLTRCRSEKYLRYFISILTPSLPVRMRRSTFSGSKQRAKVLAQNLDVVHKDDRRPRATAIGPARDSQRPQHPDARGTAMTPPRALVPRPTQGGQPVISLIQLYTT